ncbi:L-rhamnose mutarotase [Cohnella terricola]|uniref:L-rhamnose mutarotase n=1 Tax=Cohnella terricola TaxID=1289167 RepID=A0A559JWK7_9BACL|nr:L-rhamnose mutarotase [Cohnella terricola]TVY04272.1 L-rhamnose mutarotase [Cohnella terricola]
MAAETRTFVYIAKLLPGKEALYRELHDRIPAQIELHLLEDGIVSLQIHRVGQELCMVIHRNPGKSVVDRNYDEELERWWQNETGQCFAAAWQPAELVYALSDQGRIET